MKKRNIKELKDLIRKTSGKTELEFKEITPEEMALVKLKIREQHRKNIRHEIILYLVSGLLTLAVIYLLYLFFKH